MKNTLKVSKIPGIGLALIAAITLALFLAACEIIPPEDEDLSGTISISPNTGVTTGMELTATYTGNENVSYQWKKDNGNVGTNSNKYTPTEAGSYTVSVSAAGYVSKTSAAVTVTGNTLSVLSGVVSISPSTGVTTGTLLTAAYTGDETVTYKWYKNNTVIEGATSATYTPTEAGSYTVSVSAAEYVSKSSAAVTVTAAVVVVEPPTLNGTWIASSDTFSTEMKLDNGNYEMTLFNSDADARLPDRKGTYTTNNGSITLTMTHVYGGGITGLLGFGLAFAFYLEDFESLDDATWYTKAEIRARIDAAGPSVLYPDDGVSFAIDALDQVFQETTSDYSLSGNTLTLTSEDEDDEGEPVTKTTIYTRLVTFDTIAAFNTWLSAQSSNTAATVYTVWLNVGSLGGDSSTLGSVGKVLRDNSFKYVYLNLSGSTFTSIGNNAFEDCDRLAGVTIGSKVTSIGDSAFGDCVNLTSITIGSGVTSIGSDVFTNCSRFTEIIVANGNANFSSGDGVLYNKEKTSLILCPIGKTSVTIPESVTSIGVRAFYDAGITSIIIPNSVTTIGQQAFISCHDLTSVTIGSGVTSIGLSAFSITGLTSVTIPDNVTSIGSGAFSQCRSLTSAVIGSGVTSIGTTAFTNCDNLTSVEFKCTLTDNTNNFGTNAFYGDLRAKYFATGGGIGIYTTTAPVTSSSNSVWTKEE